MRTHKALIIMATVFLAAGIRAAADNGSEDLGFLERPPVFIVSLPYFPLTGMGAEMPLPGRFVPDIDAITLGSQGFNQNGVNVQPNLSVNYTDIRVGALRGFNGGWAAGASIPWYRITVRGAMAGLPTTSTVESVGGISLIGKKEVWSSDMGRRLVFTAGVQLPNGVSTARFDQSNPVTNSYYNGFPQRMPISWQPSTGTLNGYLALAYGSAYHRLSYVGLLATKLHTADDEGVSVGNMLVAAVDATYGVSKKLALSLGLTLCNQADDSYPENPNVNRIATAGTTLHGTTLYLDPSFRYNLFGKLVVGMGLHYPVVKPDDGLVPDVRVSIIAYPSF